MFAWIGSFIDGFIGLAIFFVVLAMIAWAAWVGYRWTQQVEKLGDNAPKLPDVLHERVYPCEEVALVTPTADRIVVRRLDPPDTIGSIVVPDVSKEPPQRGVVVAAGPGARDVNGRRIPMDVSEGDQVMFGKFSGTEITVGGEDLLMLNEREVLGVVR